MTHHILVVEDEAKLAQLFERFLQYKGYQVSVASDGLAGLATARESQPDLLILDWMLPGVSGLEICRRLRSTGVMVPIILLIAKDEVSDPVAGLDGGADDYLVKPFYLEELFARVRAHLHPNQEEDSDTGQFADLSLNRSTREVYRGDRLIELTAEEFDLLDYLLSHPCQPFHRRTIFEQVWGCDWSDDNLSILDQCVCCLRKKLTANGEKPLVQVLCGVGYVLRE
ncbi:MAG: response regulator transcription factor [Coleofasciculus sp. G3-WIS-01]|uniref:response regulator transcription factor n=1 Tax=Coleofasciculus sp. G3-WIS-01 TaxID=3069528 RepID=UPI0032F68235